MIELARTTLGRVAVDDRILSTLAELAAGEVGGIHTVKRGVEVDVDDDRSVSVSLAVVVRPGTVMPEAGRAVQERVAEALTTALDAPRVRVDVTIDGTDD